MSVTKEDSKEDCETCKFNIAADDQKVRCEFLKLLGKASEDPACEHFEPK